MAKHNVYTETTFVAGDKEVNTGSCGTFTDWETGTRDEAKRIADGLGGVVVEETPRGQFTFDWPAQKPTNRNTQKEVLKLAVVVDGRTVARVTSTEFVATEQI